MPEKFYDKFSKKSSSAKSNSKTHSKLKGNFERNGSKKELEKRIAQNEKLPFQNGKKDFYNSDFVPRKINREKDALVRSVQKMFDSAKLSKESRIVLENFDEIVQGVRPLNSRQFVQLHRDIRNLSHRLTDEREERRMGYMNANEELSAYVRYFSWWNLVRFTRIFSNLPENAFNLNDGDCCIDIGSGPLTVVIAMWLSRPELREKKTYVVLHRPFFSSYGARRRYLSFRCRAASAQRKKSTSSLEYRPHKGQRRRGCE